MLTQNLTRLSAAGMVRLLSDLSEPIGASVVPAYVAVPSPYAAPIAAILASYGKSHLDPALVEGWMRLTHRTLDHLTPQQFRLQVASSATCVAITPLTDSIETAASFGLVRLISPQDIASPAHPASGGVPSRGAVAATAALPTAGSDVAPHPTPAPRRSFAAGLRRIAEVVGEAPTTGRAVRWQERH